MQVKFEFKSFGFRESEKNYDFEIMSLKDYALKDYDLKDYDFKIEFLPQ